MKKLLALATFIFTATSSFAFSFNDILLWAGSGSKRAGLVIDFKEGSTRKSFAWGYRYDGAATGEDLLRAVDALDTQLSATIIGSSFGNYVDAMTYKTFSGAPWPTGYFSYWTGTPDAWTYSSVGMSTRTLVDGGWDGWSYVANGASDAAPVTPVAAVPEPASVVALGLGLLLVRGLKRVR